MGDVILGQGGGDLVQLHGVWRGVLQFGGARGSDDTDRAEARGPETHSLPDLAHEGGDGGLAIGAGNRDDQIGLFSKVAGCHAGEDQPGIVHRNHRNAGIIDALARQHRHGSGGHRLRNKF